MPTGIYKRKPRTEETKKRIKDSQKGENGYWFGKHLPKKTRAKMSKIKIGHPGYWKGKNLTEEHKQKLRQQKLGSKSPSWKGGISFEPYPIDWTDILKDSIRQRDNYVCKICGIHQDELTGFIKKLDVHHIDYDKDNLDHENLITLCHSCHIKTNYNREYWLNYFNDC